VPSRLHEWRTLIVSVEEINVLSAERQRFRDAQPREHEQPDQGA